MKALVTGGAGFVGSHLCEVLLARGWQVQILDDLSTGTLDNVQHLFANENFSYAIDSVFSEVVLDRLTSECDVIFHLAAAVGVELIVKSPFHTILTNVGGTDAVLKVGRRYRRRVLITSTSEVYGKSTKIPFREEDDTVSGPTIKHRWAYAASKAIDEFAAFAAAKESGIPVHIVRLFNTVGPRQTGRYGMVIPRFVNQALANEPITVYGTGKQSRCFANVRDVAGALVDVVQCDACEGEVVNLGSPHEITINDLAARIIELLDSDSTIVHIPYDEAYEEGFEDMNRRVPCLDKAKRLIGYEPTVSLDDTILQVAEQIRGQH